MLQCRLCELIDPELNNVENAKNLQTSESTIRRHKAADHNKTITGDDPFFGIPSEIITSRGKTVRLADGSYEKVTYNPARMALLEARNYDDIERAIEGFKFKPPVHTLELKPTTAWLCATDFQLGKQDRLGGTEQTELRIMASFHRAAEAYKVLQPQEIVVADLGDIIENFYNTSSQRQTNDQYLTQQIRTARKVMVEGLKLLAPLTPRLTYLSVPSNHCQVRIGPKSPASVPGDDFGIDISHTIEERFSDHPSFQHVQFVRPATDLEVALTHTTYDGTVVGAAHGDQASNAFKIGEWWEGLSHGRVSNLHNADHLFVGHWHNFCTYPSGDDRRVWVAPTSDPGSSWYTNISGQSSKPGMLSVTLQNGQYNDVRIF